MDRTGFTMLVLGPSHTPVGTDIGRERPGPGWIFHGSFASWNQGRLKVICLVQDTVLVATPLCFTG